MSEIKVEIKVERLRQLRNNDLAELCDAAEAAIVAGGGFGWLSPPDRDVMESYWRGVFLIPEVTVFVGRLDGVIAACLQLARPPRNAEARAHAANISTFFIAPWARGHGLSHPLLDAAEEAARREGFTVVNLDVRETQSRAIHLFDSRGYERWGRHPQYARVGGTYVAGLYYTKVLSP